MARAKEPQKFIDKFVKKAFGRSPAQVEEKQVGVSVAKESKGLTSGIGYLRESIKSRAFAKKSAGIKLFRKYKKGGNLNG